MNTNFSVMFGSVADKDQVLAYQWFLDENLIIDVDQDAFSCKISCGQHRIGVRILSDEGWSAIQVLKFETCKVPTIKEILGADIVEEGTGTYYYVIQRFSDGSFEYITSAYTFQSTEGGSFNSNRFTASEISGNDDLPVTITALRDGVVALTKDITIHNTNAVVLVSYLITGPGSLMEDQQESYFVYGIYSDGSQVNMTSLFAFVATEGSFTGNLYTADVTGLPGQVKNVTIVALQDGVEKVSKQVTVQIKIAQAGVLVIDLYNSSALDVIGLVDNSQVAYNHTAAYAGMNIVPAHASAADALVLASDMQPGNTNHRFEFNIAKLIRENPNITNFVFYLKGRSTGTGWLTGAFSLKTEDAVMTLDGSPGNYMPKVIGGGNFTNITNFQSYVIDGANGSHLENDLRSVIRFNYNVLTATLTYVTAVPPVQISNFDFLTVRYQWLQGAGSDLDILVGFENNGTESDGAYVGYNSGNITVPPNTVPPSDAYLWWASDNTGSAGIEAVLVGIQAFLGAYPNTPEVVELGLYAVWFGTPVTGNFSVQLTTYQGGTMSLQGTNFINTGGTQVYSNSFPMSTVIRKTAQNPANYYKVGRLRYNKTTQSAVIDIMT